MQPRFQPSTLRLSTCPYVGAVQPSGTCRSQDRSHGLGIYLIHGNADASMVTRNPLPQGTCLPPMSIFQVFIWTNSEDISQPDTQYSELVASVGHTGLIQRFSSLADNKFLPSQAYTSPSVTVPVNRHRPCLMWLHEVKMELEHVVRRLGWNSCYSTYMSFSQRNVYGYAIQSAVALVYFICRTLDLLMYMARSLAIDKLIWRSYSTYPQWVLLRAALADSKAVT